MWTFKKTSTVPHTTVSYITPSEPESFAPDSDALQRFTPTGRPIPKYKQSALQNMGCGDFHSTAVQHLPVRFTDDSILNIPIPYRDLCPTDELDVKFDSSHNNGPVHTGGETRRSSVFRKLKRGDKERKQKEGFRLVRMTRREYLMYWAKDEQGHYIGTEPKEKRVDFWKAREGL